MKFIKYPDGTWWEWDISTMTVYNIIGCHRDIDESALRDCQFADYDSWHELYKTTGYDPLKNNRLWHDGWISPYGDFYPCDAHEADAETIYMLVYGEEHAYYGDRMIEKGWKKVTNSPMFSLYDDEAHYKKFSSSGQKRTFLRWYEKYMNR